MRSDACIGVLFAELHFPENRSLKEKRRVLRPLIQRLRRDLHLSVAEVGDNDLWNVAVIGIACVASTKVDTARTLERAIDQIESHGEVRVESVIRGEH